PHGFREGDVLNFLDKLENIAGLVAAEAVIELLDSVHGKRCCFLAVKRTRPRIVLRPSLLQLHVVADDADDIRLLLERLFEIVSGGHGWSFEDRHFSFWDCELDRCLWEY